ncbi:uncharacterized protein [Acropora muricata]|uniref:uncharacterized protein n=1 Tax=Acropora muricata TaxID=159855 RepID=UPI0034E3BC11
MIQEICHGKDWDEPIDGEVLAKWERWRSQLPLLKQLDIARNFKPLHFRRIVTAQLHNMSDASQTGYGQCSYLRLVDENGRNHFSLVLGKACVASLRSVTIPRLELTAATESVRVANVLKEELDYEELQDFYWTDSKVVLGFHVYVANRTQFIPDQTSADQWRYVESESNPADEGSRGVNAKDFIRIRGLEFLWQTEDHWPRQGLYENEIQESCPEVKKVTANTTVIEEYGIMLSRFERLSSWQRLKTAIALCMEYKRRLRKSISTADKKTPVDESSRINGRSCKTESYLAADIIVQDLEQAEVEILKIVQRDAFDKEVKTLKESHAQTEGARKDRQCAKEKKALLKKTSSLHTLDPYLDVTRVLRVGGQITKADLTDSLKNPVILQKLVISPG